MLSTDLTRCTGRTRSQNISRSFRLTAAAVVIVGAFVGTPALAGTDPTLFISNLGNQLQTVARQPSPVQRQPGFRQLFEEDFDVPGISRFVLGRFSRVLTPSEQQQLGAGMLIRQPKLENLRAY
jgi:ABC-type transporter MlaC component